MTKRLEEQRWYHGIRTKEDIENELKEPGDFLVRAEQQSEKKFKIILDVLGKNGLCQYLLLSEGDDRTSVYFLNSQKKLEPRPEFPTVFDLVNYFRIAPLPGGLRLKHGVPRPFWLLKHSLIQFNEATDKLGEGNFCAVFKGKFVEKSGNLITVAVKVCHQVAEDTDEAKQAQADARADMLQEAKLMSKYRNAYVINFFGVACDHPPILIVMEFCPGGCLKDHITKYQDITPQEQILYCFEVARGMRYLHRQKCIHRDLATRNCLISSKGLIKIADFGLSKIISDLQKGKDSIKHIPIRWMAPETLTKTPLYSLASDVWSYGVLIYEVFNKAVAPWPDDMDFKAMGKRIRNFEMPEIPKNTPEIMRNLVENDIWVEAEARKPFKDILLILTNHIFEKLNTFPTPVNLFVNKIKGVNREVIFSETKEQILAEEEEIKSPSSVARKRRKTKRSKRAGNKHGGSTSSTRASTNSRESLTGMESVQQPMHGKSSTVRKVQSAQNKKSGEKSLSNESVERKKTSKDDKTNQEHKSVKESK